jgi:hypothetical protein
MTATDLSRRFEERYPNGRFRIRKRTFGQAAANDRSWPIPVVQPFKVMGSKGSSRAFASVMPEWLD